jgi:hypothetical protein
MSNLFSLLKFPKQIKNTKQYFPTEFIKSTKSFKLVGKIGAKEKKGSQNKIYFYFSY